MWKLLALGLFVGACSGNALPQETSSLAGGGDAPSASAAGNPASSAGSAVAAAVTPSAGTGGVGSAAGETSTGSISTQAGASTTSGSGGQLTTGGAGGVIGGGATAGGSGGMPGQAGATHEAGSPSIEPQGGGSDGGDSSGGASGAPADPCEGVAHWSPTDKITDYTPMPPDAPGNWLGDLRVFGGILWAAQAPIGCQTYPGHDASSGWIEVATCASGPITETASCQCAAGACCDGCYLRPRSYFCGKVARSARCTAVHGTEFIEYDYWNLFCSGAEAAECTVWAAHVEYAGLECGPGLACSGPDGAASCQLAP